MVSALTLLTAQLMASSTSQPGSATTVARGVLRIATSEDALHFAGPGDLFVAGGCSPALVQLDNDELLAVFQSAGGGKTPQLYASRSRDGGKAWLPAREVRIQALPEGVEVTSPCLVAMPSGLARMYFVLAQTPVRARARADAIVSSAVSRNGVDFRLDGEFSIRMKDAASVRIVAFQADRSFVLLAESGEPGRAGTVRQFMSRDGRSFSPADRSRQSGSIGQVLRFDKRHWRMYVPANGSVYTRLSDDGTSWRSESGVCIENASEASVAAAGKGKYVMLFGTPQTTQDAQAKAMVSVSNSAGEKNTEISAKPQAAPSDTGSSNVAKAPENSQTEWSDFTRAEYTEELGEDGAGSTAADNGVAAVAEEMGFAPVPDLQHHFDYIAWYEQNMLVPDDQSASQTFAAVVEEMKKLPDEAFKDRYNADDKVGPPAPWKPADHPLWESSYQAQQGVLDALRTASEDPRPYSARGSWPDDMAPEDRTMLVMLLPSLAQFRGANRAMLSQAWRAPDGVVPPEQMRDALGASLGMASHLQNGPTLIERLVACANRGLAEENARWALHQNVFKSADEIEATLNLLRERDVPEAEPGKWIAGEHAMDMDIVQYVMEPAQPGGDPAVRRDRLDKLMEVYAGDIKPEDVLQATADDARSVLKSLDGYFHELKPMWEQSWPYAMPTAPDALAKQYVDQNPLCGALLPSLARAHINLRRSEASRRATQLAYSVELYRARNGRYPTSFDDLPSEQVSDVRTDPFSGRDFAYRLTDNGASIYSVSDNGQDDGGIHSRRWGDDDRKQPSDDHVFWPPPDWSSR